MVIEPVLSTNETITRNRDDAIRYRIVRRRTLTNDTVRVNVHVNMLVNAAIQDTARIHADILAALRLFIKDAPWVLSVIERNTASVVGYEQIVTTAFATIPARENFNLPGRTHQASRQGLVLSNPHVDYQLPLKLVEQAVHDLRMDTMRQIYCDIKEYNMATGRPWRIGEVSLGQADDWNTSTTMKGAQRNSGHRAFEDYDDDGYDEVGGMECITLVTNVCLYSDQAPVFPSLTHYNRHE